MYRRDRGADYRWNTDRVVNADDFNSLNSVAIFAGPLLEMYTTVTREEVRILLDRGEDVVLLNVLDGKSFEKEHICGSVNIPVSRIEMDARRLLKEDDLIIAYSSGPRCTANAVAADKLVTIGFENVLRYAGGLDDWKKAGYCTEGMPGGLKKAA